MTIKQLCDGIGLQPEVADKVLAAAETLDFSTLDGQLKAFRDYGKMENAWKELELLLGEDEDHTKMFACTLKASVDIYELYQQKGISDQIYFDTMKCYPRFIGETGKMTGRLYYDRYWWTVRQAGGHEFRIGALEYEMVPQDEGNSVSVHIPSDADFSPASVDASLSQAKAFFARHYPAFDGCEYRCDSWLLNPQLREMLEPGSNILSFQERFELLDEGRPGRDYIQWLYMSQTEDLTTLPENTSLQRKVKAHVLSGGVMRNVRGRMK